MEHMANIILIKEAFDGNLSQFFKQFVAFESKGLCIKGVVVLLCDFLFDAIDVLTIVQIFEYARDLVVGVNLRFLVEWLWSFHLF